MGRGDRRVRRATVTAIVLALAATAAAQTDDGDPTVVAPRPELTPLQLYDIDAALEFEWRRNVDEREPRGGGRDRTEEDRLREILELRTSGFVGHPNLLELDLGGRIWLEQRWLETSTTSRERTNQDLYEWDISGYLIKESKLPVTIYTRQNISEIDRAFTSSLENTFRETGLRLNLRDEVAPTNVQIFRREIDQDTIQADGRVQLGPAHRFAWDAKYDDVDESGDLRTPRSFDRFEANATHTVEFGDDQQNLLRTRVRLFDESGDRELRQIRADPRLRLRHSDTLQSWYDYSFGRDDRPNQEQTTHRATANFQHRLFDSLTTVGTAGVEFFDVDTQDFDSDEYFARIDSEYLKRVPLGRLAATAQGSFSRVDQSDRGVPIAISDEVYTFNAADFIVIDRRNVIPSSIFMTNISGIIVYSEGTDYTVLGFPDRVEIRRVPGGNILPGQTVLIDYIIGPEPGGRSDTLGAGIDARYTFDEGPLRGLSVYTQYFRQWEDRDFNPEFRENDFWEVRYGLEYNIWKLYFKAEQQHRRGALSPFDNIWLEGRYVEQLGPGSNLVLSALFQEIDRTDDDIRTSTATLSGQWNQRIDDAMRLSLLVQYQWSDDNVDLDVQAFEQQFDVVWRRGQTEVYAQIRNSIRDTNADDTTFQKFVVGVRREF
jgi:hypothetical protein